MIQYHRDDCLIVCHWCVLPAVKRVEWAHCTKWRFVITPLVTTVFQIEYDVRVRHHSHRRKITSFTLSTGIELLGKWNFKVAYIVQSQSLMAAHNSIKHRQEPFLQSTLWELIVQRSPEITCHFLSGFLTKRSKLHINLPWLMRRCEAFPRIK